jgi:hypothetical protein
MYFDEIGCPVDSDASDKADSARLAGLLAITLPAKCPPLLQTYFTASGSPVRHPAATSYPECEPRVMSRDQLVCLSAGLYFQSPPLSLLPWKALKLFGWFAPNDMDERSKKWKVPDFLPPSVRGHIRACSGLKRTILQRAWLYLDLWINGLSWFKLKEQNQIQSMALVAGPKACYYYMKWNNSWRQATRLYWVDNRVIGEPELTLALIRKIEEEGAKYEPKSSELPI